MSSVEIDPITGAVTLDKRLAGYIAEHLFRTTYDTSVTEPFVKALGYPGTYALAYRSNVDGDELYPERCYVRPRFGAGTVLTTEDDYKAAPVGTVVKNSAFVVAKREDGRWYYEDDSNTDDKGMTYTGPRKVVEVLEPPFTMEVGAACRTDEHLDSLPVGTTLWFHSTYAPAGKGGYFTKEANNEFRSASSWVADNHWLLIGDDAEEKGRIIRSLPRMWAVGDEVVSEDDHEALPVNTHIAYDGGCDWVKRSDGLWYDLGDRIDGTGLSSGSMAESYNTRHRKIVAFDVPEPVTFKVGDEVRGKEQHDALPVGTVIAFQNLGMGIRWYKQADGTWNMDCYLSSGRGVPSEDMGLGVMPGRGRRIVSLPDPS